MHFPRFALSTVIAVTCLVPSSAISDQASDDWIHVIAKAGPGGASDVKIFAEITVETSGVTPSLIGSGVGTNSLHGSSIFDVRTLGGGPTEIWTSDEAGSIAWRTSERTSERGYVLGLGITTYDLAPGQIESVVLFATGAESVGFATDPLEFTSGSATMEIEHGAASTMIAPGRGGIAGGVGSSALGRTSRTFDSDRGIVGAISWTDCVSCAGTWRAPGEEAVVWAATARGQINSTFGGKAGSWSFEWNGLVSRAPSEGDVAGSPAIAAFVPIGDRWVLFDQAHATMA
jgi:hypothetical protein